MIPKLFLKHAKIKNYFIIKGDGMEDKNSDNNTVQKEENKNKTTDSSAQILFLGEYFSVHTRQYHPITLKFIERETQRLIDWANEEDSLIIQKFWLSGGYSKAQFYVWINQFPEFAHAHEYAMTLIGTRRELGAMTRKFDASTIHRTLGRYNHIWKEETQELARLKDDAAQNEAKVVVIERFPVLPSSSKTPEEVAMAIRKSTGDNRNYGPYDVNKEE